MFDPPERGFEPQIFSNFHDLNFHEREGDEIKSNQNWKILLGLRNMQEKLFSFEKNDMTIAGNQKKISLLKGQ